MYDSKGRHFIKYANTNSWYCHTTMRQYKAKTLLEREDI